MAYIIGVTLALTVAAVARLLNFERDRSFYATILMVIASYYVLFALMVDRNSNPQIHFFQVPEHDHFSLVAPLAERLAAQIAKGEINVTQRTIQGLR